MVSIKDFVISLFNQYYWGIFLVLGLMGLLFLVVVPNTDYILGKMGVETKSSLREQKQSLRMSIAQLQKVNDENKLYIQKLQQIQQIEKKVVESNQVEKSVIVKKINVVKQSIQTPKNNSHVTSKEIANNYHIALMNAFQIANGESS